MNAVNKIPIVVAAFGTTTKALETYSSRMVKDRIKNRLNIELKHPYQVLAELEENGHQWAVVQSLHLLCGHEFYRLVEEVKQCSIRTAMGLPLLSSHEDYDAVVQGLGCNFPDLEKEVMVLVGHGTDHPAWSSYVALQHMFREKFGDNIYVGVVEGNPSKEKVIASVMTSGIKRVRLVPFMLVAGTHFQEDLAGNEDSWKRAFEVNQISVSIETRGLGFNREVADIFLKHIKEALDMIPNV